MKILAEKEVKSIMANNRSKSKRSKICLTLPPEIDEALEVRAFRERTTKSLVTEAALLEFLQSELDEIKEGKGR